MITITTKSPDLSIPFADVLNVDTIQDLKDSLGMMGMRFTGKLNSLKAATPQGFAARQEDIDSLMTVVGRVRNTIINMQEAVDKTRGYTQATC